MTGYQLTRDGAPGTYTVRTAGAVALGRVTRQEDGSYAAWLFPNPRVFAGDRLEVPAPRGRRQAVRAVLQAAGREVPPELTAGGAL